MTSSTSSSDTEASERRWRGWVPAFLMTFFGGAALLYAALLLIDPYDSDRFVNLGLIGVHDANLRTADVSRARDQQFDSLILGSSTGQSLDPHRLSAATGFRFVQLAITQAGPREMMALLGWFRKRHDRMGAVVFVADIEWCSARADLNLRYPFPFWLYGNDWDYLAHVLNWKAFDRAAWRIQVSLGKRTANDPAGYFPFTSQQPDRFLPLPPQQPDLGPPSAPFPWIERLAAVLSQLPPSTAVVVLMPPVVHEFLPPAGSPEAARVAACKQELAALLSRRSHGSLIDDRVESPVADDRANFYDRIHYRADVARELEQQVIAALTRAPNAQARTETEGKP